MQTYSDALWYPYLSVEKLVENSLTPQTAEVRLVVQDLRRRGILVVYGDAGNPTILEHAGAKWARVLALLISDAHTAEVAARHAIEFNPNLEVVATAVNANDVVCLQRAGATEVVQPEFEAGIEVIRHTLRRYGIVSHKDFAASRRALHYRRPRS